MHDSVLLWGDKLLTSELCAGKMVLEVGSQNVNGSLRPFVERHSPKAYIGVDLAYGRGVNIAVPLADIHNYVVPPFDMVICTEMLEHAEEWALDMIRMTHMLTMGGTIILSTRSVGFPYHGFPHDYWRFSFEAMSNIMSVLGFNSTVMTDDPRSPGVLAAGVRVRPMADAVFHTLMNMPGVTPMEQPR